MRGEELGLDTQIVLAHEAGDKTELAKLYFDAALFCDEDKEKSCFLLTNAYVCALEAGLEISAEIHARLVKLGRES